MVQPSRPAFVALAIALCAALPSPAAAQPYDGAAMAMDWNQALRETLLTDVRTLQWHYQDGRTGAWTQQWDASQAQYPARIRLELGDARGDWPPLVFALARAR